MAIEDIYNIIKENGFKYVVLERKVFGEKFNIFKKIRKLRNKIIYYRKLIISTTYTHFLTLFVSNRAWQNLFKKTTSSQIILK